MNTEDLIKKLTDLDDAATQAPWTKPYEDGAISSLVRPRESLLSIDRDGMSVFEDPVDCELTVLLRNNLTKIIEALKLLNAQNF